jgi:hypothetical protein
MAEEKGSSITLHAHGDGTYHTTSGPFGDGKRTEHPSIGHALMHIAQKHSEGDHFHAHATDDGVTTHSVLEGGKVQGPEEHPTVRGLKRSLSDFLDSGESE